MKNIFLLETQVSWTTKYMNKIIIESSMISRNKLETNIATPKK